MRAVRRTKRLESQVGRVFCEQQFGLRAGPRTSMVSLRLPCAGSAFLRSLSSGAHSHDRGPAGDLPVRRFCRPVRLQKYTLCGWLEKFSMNDHRCHPPPPHPCDSRETMAARSLASVNGGRSSASDKLFLLQQYTNGWKIGRMRDARQSNGPLGASSGHNRPIFPTQKAWAAADGSRAEGTEGNIRWAFEDGCSENALLLAMVSRRAIANGLLDIGVFIIASQRR